MAQYRVKRRKALAEKQKTLEKIKSLGPLKLTIELEDCMKPIPVETYLETFCESLEVEPQPSFCELLDDSLTDLDLGDPPVWYEWLDDLLDDLSTDGDLSFDNNINDLSSNDLSKDSDLSSSFCDLSFEEWIECQTDSSFDLEDFVS